jgi:hypothetical protein
MDRGFLKGAFMLRMIVGIFFLTTVVSRAATAETSNPTIRYYLSIYSYDDGVLNLPRNAHTFAGFIAYDHANQTVIERFSISWLPSVGTVSLFGPIERGRNYTVPETFQIAWRRQLDILRFGPHEVGVEFFQLARNQWARLEQATIDGSILYKAVDGDLRYRSDYPVINCMHAVSGIIGDLEMGRLRGRSGSSRIDGYFSPFYLETEIPDVVFKSFLAYERGH